MMSAEACGVKAAELDGKAGECFSAEAADSYRTMAGEWRLLQAQSIAQAERCDWRCTKEAV
jgi:hypothetical protein